MRRLTQRHRARAEEGAAEVGAAAAPARDDPARRSFERSVSSIDDAGSDERRERAVGSFDMELVARLPAEGAAAVRTDLRWDLLIAEEGERAPCRRAACEIEVQRPLALGAEVKAPRRVEERRELREAIARALWGNAAELLADVLGGPQRSTPSSASSRRLTVIPAEP